MDKQERRRLKRERLRKERARKDARDKEARARKWRAFELADAAEDGMHARAYGLAADRAARAAALAPRDAEIAALYVQAAERTGDPARRLAALEHFVAVTQRPSTSVLVALADLHRGVGNPDRARELAGQARQALATNTRGRRGWLAILDGIEHSISIGTRIGTGAAAAGDGEGDARGVERPGTDSGAEQISLLFASPSTAAEARRSPPGFPSDGADPVAATGDAESGAVASTPARDIERAPEPPAAPAVLGIPVSFSSDIAGIEALDGPAAATLEDVELALRATALRDAESFDRLLGLERARGLVRLSHQEETVRKVLAVLFGRALLADEVGLGKTVEAGLVLSEYLLRGRVASALVLCPPTLCEQWREELLAKFDIPTRSHGDPGHRGDPASVWTGPGVVVASLATARSERHRELCVGRPWDLVIVDEAHALKNHRTESYALVEALKTRFLLLLTATPIENRVEELFNLVSLIRPGHLGGRAAFLRRFARKGGQLADEARSEVRALLAELMVRNTRALSGVRLPPRFARTRLVEPGEDERRLYETVATALRALRGDGRARSLCSLLLQEAGSSPRAVGRTLDRLAGGGDVPVALRTALTAAAEAARRADGSEKARVLIESLDSAAGGAVVFTRFRATLDFLAGAFERAGIAHERLDGDMPAPARAAAVERCRASGGVLLSTDVGSEGLNLQFCRRLVNFDLPWNPMRLEQRIGRIHRIGQEHPVDVVTLCLAGSIEEKILGVLDERINLFELVVGEVEMILGYLDDPREFPEMVLDAFAQPDEATRSRSFQRVGDGLAAARKRYRGVKLYDEALFKNELGV